MVRLKTNELTCSSVERRLHNLNPLQNLSIIHCNSKVINYCLGRKSTAMSGKL